MISMIAALTKNNIIGINNTQPLMLPADLSWFKYNTLKKPIIMGRITFESIGRPLPDRCNIVISKKYNNLKNVICVNTLQKAISVASNMKKEIMIIGGGSIYNQMLKYADRLYLTYIDAEIEGDIKFPEFNELDKWETIFSEYHDIDNFNIYSYCFKILERKKSLKYF